MSELIGIREAARRLGVSDTAVHKAIKAGRVVIAGRTEGSNRPLLAWPAASEDWQRNSDVLKRTHIGGTGKSPRRSTYDKGAPPAVPLPTREETLNPPPAPAPTARAATKNVAAAEEDADDIPAPAPAAAGPSLAQSRAIREVYAARLAKLEYEKAVGKVIEADAVKLQAFKIARSVRDALLNLPDRVSAELAAEVDPVRVHLRLSAEIRKALESLSAAVVAS